MAKGRPVGTTVVEEIAAREGIKPVELDVVLHDVIDADALETLTDATDSREESTPLEVTFPYHGYTVTVDETGAVTVEES